MSITFAFDPFQARLSFSACVRNVVSNCQPENPRHRSSQILLVMLSPHGSRGARVACCKVSSEALIPIFFWRIPFFF
jgi:hypothetical protein